MEKAVFEALKLFMDRERGLYWCSKCEKWLEGYHFERQLDHKKNEL